MTNVQCPILTVQSQMCERCGEQFTCGASLSGCWCQEIQLSEAVQAELRANYERCLCRKCLEEFAKGEGCDGEEKKPILTGATY